MCHNYRTCAPEPKSPNYWAHTLQLLKPMGPRAHDPHQEKPLQWEAHGPQLESSPRPPQLEKSLLSNQDPAQPKIFLNGEKLWVELIEVI